MAKPPALSALSEIFPPHERAREALQHLADAVGRGQPVNEDILRWLAAAAREIVAGTDPRDALALSAQKGRKRNEGRKVTLALAVADEIGRDPKKRGARDRALDKLSGQTGMSRRTLELCFDQYGHLAPIIHDIDRRLAAATARLRADTAPAKKARKKK